MALLTIKYNGTDILSEGNGSNWVRALGKELSLGSMAWPVPVIEAGGWGAFVAGEGVPEARQVGFMIYCDMVSTNVDDILYETIAKWDLLCAQFKPTVMPVPLEITRTDGDNQTTTRTLMVRTDTMYTWAWNYSGDGSAGGRLSGKLRFPVTAMAHLPWWIQSQDQETGSNTALSASDLVGAGDRRGGWRASFVCPSGQTAGITPTVVVNGISVPFVWQSGLTWAVGDTVVIDCYYPLSSTYPGGIVSYIIKANGTVQNYGCLSPNLSGVVDLPLIPVSGEFDVSFSITGLNANGVSKFDWCTLHGSL
jgi:hypothetical protein